MDENVKKLEKELKREQAKLNLKIAAIEKRNSDLRKTLLDKEVTQKNILFKIKNQKTGKTDSVCLIGKEINPQKNIFKKIITKLKKVDGYIFHIPKGETLKIIAVKNMKYWYQKHKEAYILHDKFTVYNNKPAMLTKYPFPISFTIKQDPSDKTGTDYLYYDTKAFYNFHAMLSKTNLIKTGEETNIFAFIKQNMVLFIILLVILYALFTPEGKQQLSQLIGGI